ITVDAPYQTFQPGVPLTDFTVHQTQYDAFGEVTAQGLNNQWQEYFQYDNAGHLWRTNQQDGGKKGYFYDLHVKVSTKIQSTSLDLVKGISQAWQLQTATVGVERTFMKYHALGRGTQQILPSFAGGSVVPVITQTLDRWGNTIAFTDARGYTTNIRYNDLNKAVEQDQPWTSVVTEGAVGLWARPVTRNYYDALGRTIGTIDANGNPSTYFYDAAGEMYVEYHADGGAVVYGYDGLGRRIRTTDALGNVTYTLYDRDDRLVQVQRPTGIETYRYDQAGNRIQSTDAT